MAESPCLLLGQSSASSCFTKNDGSRTNPYLILGFGSTIDQGYNGIHYPRDHRKIAGLVLVVVGLHVAEHWMGLRLMAVVVVVVAVVAGSFFLFFFHHGM